MLTRLTLFLMILAVLGITVACNSGTGVIPTDPSIAQFLSVDVCEGCHKSTAAEWAQTRHAFALPDLLASGHAGDQCLPCHTVGLDGNPANSGYDDPDPTVAERFGGVQCEGCHGLGGEHVVTFDPLPKHYGSDLCAECHVGSHHPTYTEWEISAHAESLVGPREASSHFSLHCLECHSADYIFADSVSETSTPFDFQYGITCVVCHDPHSGANEYQLRTDVLTLCYECHTSEGSRPGATPHHPNGDMFQGMGGYEYPGEDYTNSAHSFFEDACVECHMWTSPFDATGNGEDAYAGHTFLPLVQACQECHADATSFDYYGAQSTITALLADLKAELDAATDADKLTLAYERAKFNQAFVAADGSFGIHNFDYAVKLLMDSLEDFEPTVE
jgi:predicted CXXCH cytochrome family protein